MSAVDAKADDAAAKAKAAKLSKEEEKAANAAAKRDAIGEVTMTEHITPIAEVLKKLETNLDTGLSSSQIDAKRAQAGENRLTPPPTKSKCKLFVENMTGFFSLLLWVAGILCFIAYAFDPDGKENLYLGIVLVTVVWATGCFSYLQEANASDTMAGFADMLPEKVNVYRDGSLCDKESWELVPGDVVLIETGDKIPADIMVVFAANFKVDNSSLTGESIPVARKVENTQTNILEATNLAFYGTMCEAGKAKGLVVGTGDNTVIGNIAALVMGTEPVETPISVEITLFIKIISYIAMFLGVTFFMIALAASYGFIENLVFCIGIIVANVPEGLLATVTVSLTLTANRMAAKKVLVKNLEAVETLGSTTVIASDKTGTLTQNMMTVAHVYYDNQIKLAHGEGPKSFDATNPTFANLQRVATLCNNAKFLDDAANLSRKVMHRMTVGDASESAFIKFCEPITPIAEVRAHNKELAQVPFNSANKFQISINLQDNDLSKPRLVSMKGAPERIFNRCDYIMVNGRAQPISRSNMDQYNEAMKRLMSDGERVLGLCMTELPAARFPEGFAYEVDDLDKVNFPMEKGEGLIFVGLMSLIDPPRAAVPGAVLNCQKAGVKVVMVTGDHPDTAEAIAKQVHIIRDPTRRDLANKRGVTMESISMDDPDIKAVVITGAQLTEMSPQEIDHWLDFDQIVFARTSPKQKLIIVQGLQSKRWIRRGRPQNDPLAVHHVVAVTGDGVNDSPALKAADIGIAMGIAGTDVAKQAADMVLLNDNFASIVDGVEEGRLIFDNLKKSIAYTLSSNIPEISPFLAFIITQIPLPLTTVLILCIDLGTDMIPAISLAYENKEANIMEKPPRDMNTERLVTVKLVSFAYLQIGIVQALAGFYTYMVVLNDYGFRPRILPGLSDAFRDFADGDSSIIDFQSNGDDQFNGAPPVIISEGKKIALRTCNIKRSDVCWNPEEALSHAQCAFFICIIVVQWADLTACKTRSLSLKQQGMRNNTLNFGLFFETALGAFLCYVTPIHAALGTRALSFVHWLPALPFTIYILFYDESRKFLLRNLGENNWFYRNTYY